MIKGILALFTSGAIFNPMILLGIGLGIFSMIRLNSDQIESLFMDYHLYVLVLVLSTAYVFLFKKIYKDNGRDLDYGSMIFSSITGLVKFVIAALLMMSFIVMISF